MIRIISIAATAVLAAAPAFAQAPPVQNRAEIPAPNEGQAPGRVVRPGTVEPGNRPVAGRSVPEPAVGQVGVQEAQPATRVEAGRIAGREVRATSVNDALFAAASADIGLEELTISQLGARRATDPELKDFSRQMIEEHTRMNGELETMAARKGIRLPQQLGIRSQFCAQSLAGLSGEEFDECYAKAQLIVHMEAVAAFEAESERGVDPDMRALATKGLPKIKAHLEQIKPIAERLCTEEGGSKARKVGAGSSEAESRIGNPGGQPIR